MTSSSAAAQPIFEEHIPAQADSLFMLGALLADYNAQGLFVEDLSQDAFFSQAVGKWGISAHKLLASSITVAVAGKQFSNLEAMDSTPMKIALLGGYLQKISLLVDPLPANFTESLLEEYFPGVVYEAPSEDISLHDPTPLLASLGYQVYFKGAEPQLVTMPPSKGLIEPSNELLLATLLLLLLLEIDIRPLIRVGEKIYPNHALFLLLGIILRKEHRKEPRFTGLLPLLFGLQNPHRQLTKLMAGQPKLIEQLLQVVAYYIENPPKEKNMDQRTHVLSALRKALHIQENIVGEEQACFLDAFCDGLHHLSKNAENQGNLYESVYLCQASQMILQWLLPGWKRAERRLCKAAVAEHRAAWRTIPMQQITSLDVFMAICTYANSALLTDSMYVKQSLNRFKKGETSNLLWSALIRAVERGRWILQLMEAFPKSTLWNKNTQVHFQNIFKRIVGLYGKVLSLHMTAAQYTFEKGVTSSIAQGWLTEEGQEEFLLKRELRQTSLLMDTLAKEGLSTQTLNSLKELLQIGAVEPTPGQTAAQDEAQRLKAFNELLDRYHAKEENLLEAFLGLLTRIGDAGMQNYCVLLVLLLATKEKQWDLALQMITYLHDTIPQAWDLPGIPIKYLGGFMGEEILAIDRILDALRTIKEHLEEQQVINALLDRYLERYVAE